EIIEINGYTPEEKIQIAKKHLIPKQRTENGLNAKDIKFTPQAINRIIQDYTRESGVRQLERKVAGVIRKVAKSKVLEEKHNKTIQPIDVLKHLGAPIYDNELYEKINVAGVATGLAWTQFGGEILFIESTLFRGKGKLTLSGKLGDVMKESATAALSYLRANAETIGIDHRVFDNFDLHIHVPSGAVPKDGPSAGITIFTSLASVFTQTKIKDKLAMTGEITLRGKVLPVGGIKEKILAAKRAGIKELILCAQNKKDVDEIKPDYIKNLKIHYVENVDEVLELALTGEKVEKPVDLSVKVEDKKLGYEEALVE
ncbi:MAG: endopeptidase La, partial [Solirubrobacterales bacterium]|nr:endopeptidase La [Solirubrobacterales bacterium]